MFGMLSKENIKLHQIFQIHLFLLKKNSMFFFHFEERGDAQIIMLIEQFEAVCNF